MMLEQIIKWMAKILILVYQYSISPLLLPSCRYTPSCSEYTKQAIEQYGLWRGIRLGALRLLRCHPFHPGGYDPPLAPEQRTTDNGQRTKFTIWKKKLD
jgi:hypothetical protein